MTSYINLIFFTQLEQIPISGCADLLPHKNDSFHMSLEEHLKHSRNSVNVLNKNRRARGLFYGLAGSTSFVVG